MAVDDLKEKRARALANAQEVISEAEEERGEDATLTSEERDQYDQWMGRYSELNDEVKEAEADQERRRRLEEAKERKDTPIAGPDADFDEPEGEGRESYDYGEWQTAFTRYLKSGGRSDLSPEENRTLDNRIPGWEARESDVLVGTSNVGGVFVPTELEDRFFDELKQFGGLLEAVEAAPGDPINFPMETDDGRPLEIVLSDDTANTAGHVNEGSTISSVSDLSLANRVLHDQVYQSGPLAITIEMMQDSVTDPEMLVTNAIRNRIGRAWARDLIESTNVTSSTGVQGLITASTGAVHVGPSSTDLAFEDLISLKYSVDPAHRAVDRRWLMHDDVFLEINKITDGNGRFILEPDHQAGAEGVTLRGDPIHLDNSSTKILFGAGSSGSKPVWYGNFARFGVRRVAGLEVQVLRELYARNRKIGFLGFVRVDARVMASTGLSASQRPIRCIRSS